MKYAIVGENASNGYDVAEFAGTRLKRSAPLRASDRFRKFSIVWRQQATP